MFGLLVATLRPHVDPDPSCVAVQAEFTKLLPGQSPAGFKQLERESLTDARKLLDGAIRIQAGLDWNTFCHDHNARRVLGR